MSQSLSHSAEGILRHRKIRPTANRILVTRALASATHPLSLADLQQLIDSMDPSSIFRALNVFVEHHMVHVLEDGSGSLKYELCHGEHIHLKDCDHQHDLTSDSQDASDDTHVHFYCEKCQRTTCFEDIPIPKVAIPEGYTQYFTNYMIKGICPSCQRKSLE